MQQTQKILLLLFICFLFVPTLSGCNENKPEVQSWDSFLSQTDTDYSGLTVSVNAKTTELILVIDNQSAHDYSYSEANICLAKKEEGGFVRIPTGGTEIAWSLIAGDSITEHFSLEEPLSKGTYRIGLQNCGAYTEFTVS